MKISDIKVSMGDGNVVGDIGHKINFYGPQPGPNAIWQNGKAIGEIGGTPINGPDGTVIFDKLFIDGAFDDSQPFEVQGIALKLENIDAHSFTQEGGRPPKTTLWRAVCRMVKAR